MAGALAKGLLATKRYRARELWASDAEPKQPRPLHARARRRTRARQTTPSSPRARSSSLAVKPQVMQAGAGGDSPAGDACRHLFVSIVAGIPTRRLEDGLGRRVRVVRAMPNTPALVGHGITVVVRGAIRPSPTMACGRALRWSRRSGPWLRTRADGRGDGSSGSGPGVYRFAAGLIAGAVAEGLGRRWRASSRIRPARCGRHVAGNGSAAPRISGSMVSSPRAVHGLGSALDERGFVDRGRRRGCGEATRVAVASSAAVRREGTMFVVGNLLEAVALVVEYVFADPPTPGS